MVTESKEKSDFEGDSRRAFKVSLEEETVVFLRDYFEAQEFISLKALQIASGEVRARIKDQVALYIRLKNSLANPILQRGLDLGLYGIYWEDFRDLVEGIETQEVRWPVLLRHLIEMHDAFVEAGAPAHVARLRWQEVADHVESRFEVWRKNEII